MAELKTYSLHRRLLRWLLIPLVIMSAAILYEAYTSSSRSARVIYDKLLLGLALSISEHTVITEGDLLSEEMLNLITQSTQEVLYYKVTGPDNAFVTGYEGLPPLPEGKELQGGIPIFYDTVYQGEPVRAVALSTFVDQLDLSGWVFVQVLQTNVERQAMVMGSVYRSALHLLLVLCLASLFTWVGINRGLQPLRNLERAIHRRSFNDLRPITRTVPKEVEQVVLATNSLFLRLEQHITRSKTFVETASHQLRTPLTALKTRIELARRQAKTDWGQDTLNTIYDETVRASRLAEQLLSLARVEPQALGEKTEENIDFSKLCSGIAIDWVTRALNNNIEIAFEEQEECGPILVDGNRILLCEILTNLIHNAINYCPADTLVTIRVGINNKDWVFLEVEDNGYGIPEKNRKGVFERFVRLDYSDGKGCGLGLPIVREIVAVHNGKIRLSDPQQGQGLVVHIDLPRSGSSNH